MPIQDNLHGALLISAIDFTLSFFIIGGIGVILALFPLLNKLGRRDSQATPAAPREPAESTVAASSSPSPSLQTAVPAGIHPGLTDQQLVVLLTAAACEVLEGPVRIDRFRPLSAKDWSWAAQGRHDLQDHRLK
jgi:hypothetical protein